MNRKSIVVSIAKFITKLPIGVFRVLEWPFLISSLGAGREKNLLILLAIPRSGSTLTYQSICHIFHGYYLSNLSHFLFKLPYFGAILSARICDGYRSDFQSDLGFVSGACGPAEGLQYWSYWLGCGLDERKNRNVLFDVGRSKRRLNYLRRVFSKLGAVNRPIISGYLGHLLCADKLKENFPNALFIVLRRDPVANILSLLKEMESNPDSDWFSCFPEECNEVKGTRIEKAVSQFYWLSRKLDKSEKFSDSIAIEYEQLCDFPNETMDLVLKFSESKGMKLKKKGCLPQKFHRSEVVENELVRKIRSELSRLEKDYGSLSRNRS